MPTPAAWLDPEYLARLRRYSDPPRCRHESSWFDRSLCWNGWMHTFCSDCGKNLDKSGCCDRD